MCGAGKFGVSLTELVILCPKGTYKENGNIRMSWRGCGFGIFPKVCLLILFLLIGNKMKEWTTIRIEEERNK